jgi:hypothetical protein
VDSLAGSWEDALQEKWKKEAERIVELKRQSEQEGKTFLLDLARMDAQRLVEKKKALEEKYTSCPPFNVRDIVTFGGTERVPMPKRTAVITQVYPPSDGYFSYGIKIMREDMAGLKPGSAALDHDTINEGPCRSADTPVWSGPLTALVLPRGKKKKEAKAALLGMPEEFEEATIEATESAAPVEVRLPSIQVVKAPITIPSVKKDDFTDFRDIVDGLLGSLPQKKIEKFVESAEYKVYSKVMENGQPEGVHKEFVEIVDTLLGDLPKKTIEEFIASPEFQVYERVIKKYKPE